MKRTAMNYHQGDRVVYVGNCEEHMPERFIGATGTVTNRESRLSEHINVRFDKEPKVKWTARVVNIVPIDMYIDDDQIPSIKDLL